MKKYFAGKSVLPFIVFFIASCVTINIYFPAAAVEKAADRIVEEVWGEKAGELKKQDEQKKQGEPQSLLLDSLYAAMAAMGPGEALAAEPDVNVTTPAIRALKGSIQQRAESITPFMNSGNAGIAGNTPLERLDAMEAELQRLTANAEQLEFRINSVVSDGTDVVRTDADR